VCEELVPFSFMKTNMLKMQTDKTKSDNDPSCNTDQGVLELCECYGKVKPITRSESKLLLLQIIIDGILISKEVYINCYCYYCLITYLY